jgi:hypothetical protein
MHEEQERYLKLIGSYSRLKLIATLIAHSKEDLTLYMLTKYSKLSKDIVRRNISILVDSGFVDMKLFGTIRIYTLNENNPILIGLSEFLIKSKLI